MSSDHPSASCLQEGENKLKWESSLKLKEENRGERDKEDVKGIQCLPAHGNDGQVAYQ